MPVRIAQGGVALGLALGMGAVVVTAQADPSSTVEQGTVLAQGPAESVTGAEAAELRAEAVDAAQAAVEQVSQVRADAAQVAVPQEVIAELDAATAELQAAIAQVDAAPVTDREPNVSRSTDRGRAADPAPAATDAAATPAPDAATPAPTDGPEAAAPLAEATVPAEAEADPATTPLREALDKVREVAQVVLTTTEQKRAEAAAAQVAAEVTAQQAARAEAEAAAAAAAQRAAWKESLEGFANGKIPASALCSPSFDRAAQLRCDAAEALEALDAAFAARFGTHLVISDSYRSYAGQLACRATKGSLCATPGTSNHGWGLAVDLGGSVQTFGSAQHQWMRENAPAFGWNLPDWARAGGSKPEPWHWEYVG